jgi:hypothetical protein
VTYSAFRDDTLAGQKVYGRGDEFIFHLGTVYSKPSVSITGDARFYLRSENTLFGEEEVVTSQTQVYGDEVFLLANLLFTPGHNWRYGVLIDYRLIKADGLGLGDSYTLAPGVQLNHWFGGHYNIGTVLKYYTGKADESAIDLSGYQVSVNIGSVF